MKKRILTLFALLSLGASPLTLEGVTPDDPVSEEGNDFGARLRKSPQVGRTEHYAPDIILPAVPVAHPYDPFGVPFVVLGTSSFPSNVLDENVEGVASALIKTGVIPDDPFYIVVQQQETGLLLRPMYYFENDKNNAFKQSSYNDVMTLKAAVYDPEGKVSIVPDGGQPENQFVVVSHNGISENSIDEENQRIVSSGNNMALQGLDKDNSTAFFAFYKGVSQTISESDFIRDTGGQPVPTAEGKYQIDPTKSSTQTIENQKGVSVLHMLLNEKDWDVFSSLIHKDETLQEIFEKLVENPILGENRAIKIMVESIIGMFSQSNE